MKAEKLAAPSQTNEKPSQTDASKQRGETLDSVFRLLRKQSQELTNVRNELSILKRDVARIDRKVYRDKELPAGLPNPNENAPNQNLDGILIGDKRFNIVEILGGF